MTKDVEKKVRPWLESMLAKLKSWKVRMMQDLKDKERRASQAEKQAQSAEHTADRLKNELRVLRQEKKAFVRSQIDAEVDRIKQNYTGRLANMEKLKDTDIARLKRELANEKTNTKAKISRWKASTGNYVKGLQKELVDSKAGYDNLYYDYGVMRDEILKLKTQIKKLEKSKKRSKASIAELEAALRRSPAETLERNLRSTEASLTEANTTLSQVTKANKELKARTEFLMKKSSANALVIRTKDRALSACQSKLRITDALGEQMQFDNHRLEHELCRSRQSHKILQAKYYNLEQQNKRLGNVVILQPYKHEDDEIIIDVTDDNDGWF